MPLIYTDQKWTVVSRDREEVQQAEALGFYHSIPASVREGRPIYYTENPYLAMLLYPLAEGWAKDFLKPLWKRYHSSWAMDGPEVPSPDGMVYRPFQRGGIHYAASLQHSLIGDEMGVGKTCQAIGVGNLIGPGRKIVVCPANVRFQWEREISKWSLDCRRIHVITRSADGVSPFADWTIVSYDLLRSPKIRNALLRMGFALVVFDEVHKVKTITSGRTRATLGSLSEPFDQPLLSVCDRSVSLSGTPLPNKPKEFYALMRHTSWDLIDFTSEEDFGFMCLRPHEIQARVRSSFMVRRLKREVLTQLPPVWYDVAFVGNNENIVKAVEAEKMLNLNVEDIETTFQSEDWGAISTARRMMGEAMAPEVVAHVKGLLEQIPKVVVFAHHREVLNYLAEHLSGGRQINGSTTPRRRQELIDEFQRDPDFRVLPGQIQSMGEGVDGLQNVCSWSVNAEPSWVPGENEQASARLDRMGQKEPVMSQLMVAENSLSATILQRSVAKLQNTHAVLDAKYA